MTGHVDFLLFANRGPWPAMLRRASSFLRLCWLLLRVNRPWPAMLRRAFELPKAHAPCLFLLFADRGAWLAMLRRAFGLHKAMARVSILCRGPVSCCVMFREMSQGPCFRLNCA